MEANCWYIIAGICAFWIISKIYGFYKMVFKHPKEPPVSFTGPTSDDEKQVGNVVFHTFGPGAGLPTPSPFCLKLLTYFRMTGIKYQCIIESQPSNAPKGKLPYVVFENGDGMGDSQLIIDRLEPILDKNGADFEKQDNVVASQAYRVMMEEHLYFAMVWFRWIYQSGFETLVKKMLPPLPFPVKFILPPYLRSGVRSQLESQGMGRHSMEDVLTFAENDLIALDMKLSENDFLGGESPCSADASAFGILANLLWSDFETPLSEVAKRKYHALESYLVRMKKLLYPDWDDLCVKLG